MRPWPSRPPREISTSSNCACASRSLAGSPATTLMFIHNAHRLHECVANRRADKSETFLLQVLAHRVAVRGRLRNFAQVQRPKALHLAARELPEIVGEGSRGRADLKVCGGIADESVNLEAIPDDPGILQ